MNPLDTRAVKRLADRYDPEEILEAISSAYFCQWEDFSNTRAEDLTQRARKLWKLFSALRQTVHVSLFPND